MAKEETGLYNKFLGKNGRTAGVYLDEVERRQLEDYRARIEGREPDYENLDIGYSPIVPESMLADNHNMSNVSAARDPQDPQPVVVIEREVFDEPNVVVRTGTNYVEQLNNVNNARAAGAPVGAPPGAYDDGGKGGPDAVSGAFSGDFEKRQKETDEAGRKAAKSVSVKDQGNKASKAVTDAPENQPRRNRADEKPAVAKKAAVKKTATKSVAKKTTTRRAR